MISFVDYTRHDGLGVAALVRAGEVSAAELLETAIARIEAHNAALNAVIRTRHDQGRAEAARIDPASPFAGVPFLLEDLIATLAGEPTAGGTACSSTCRWRATVNWFSDTSPPPLSVAAGHRYDSAHSRASSMPHRHPAKAPIARPSSRRPMAAKA